MAADELSSVFAALADPTRRAILARLAEGEATVNELAAPFPMSLQAVSKHLKVLERAGLIVRGRDAQWRPCRLDPAPLRDIAEWIQQYRRLWAERYEHLDGYLRELEEENDEPGQQHQPDRDHPVRPGDRDDPGLRRAPGAGVRGAQ